MVSNTKKSLVVKLSGKRWIVDYGDDRGMHGGVEEGFWFEDEVAHARVLEPLRVVGSAGGCEVWT